MPLLMTVHSTHTSGTNAIRKLSDMSTVARLFLNRRFPDSPPSVVAGWLRMASVMGSPSPRDGRSCEVLPAIDDRPRDRVDDERQHEQDQSGGDVRARVVAEFPGTTGDQAGERS